MQNLTNRRKILFFSEAVTLAHVSRPLALMEALKDLPYDLHFACAYRHESTFGSTRATYWPIESISYDAFVSSSSGEKTAYTEDCLARYLTDEDGLIEEIQPDLIVNDARFTLCVSAVSAKVPLVNINNAYWSPYRRDKTFPLPAYKRSALFNMFPPALAERLFPYALVKRTFPLMHPFYQWRFLAPFNQARQRRGLPALRHFDLLHTYGDWTLYCDPPELFSLRPLPPTHRFLGPLLWSPPGASLGEVPGEDSVLYVSFGSSNDVPRCHDIVAALTNLNVRLLVATAGRFSVPASERVHVATFLPGLEASRAAALVLCSGGSTAAYQALSVGTPVLGLPSNADQHLAMGAIERWGAGLSLRADQATPEKVCALVSRMLADPSFKTRAVSLATHFTVHDARKKFQDFVQEILPPRDGPAGAPGTSLQTLPDRLRRQAERSPQRPAFWDLAARQRGDLPIAYGDLWAQVQGLAASLSRLGLAHGDRVGFLAGVTPDWERLHMAVLLAGGVVVGLDLHDTSDRVRNVAGQSGMTVWVVQNEKVLSDWLSLFEGARLVVLLEGEAPQTMDCPVVSVGDLLRTSDRGGSPSTPHPEDLATIVFTSGTTGEPKGIPYTHRQLTHAVRAINRAYRDLPEGVQTICWLPLSNLFQRMVNLCAMDRGGLITFVPFPHQLVESLPLVRPDVLIGVPRFYEKMEAGILKAIAAKPRWVQFLFQRVVSISGVYRMARHRGNPLRFIFWPLHVLLDVFVLRAVRRPWGGRLRYLISGAAALHPKTLRFFWGVGFLPLEAYGVSENPVPIALNRPDDFLFGTVGQPLQPNNVSITSEREVLVKGPSLFGNYWGQPRNQALFTADYYRTGDEGRLERHGHLKLIGRLSDYVKTSTGRRVAPAPIESYFKELPFVDQAVVMGSGRKGPVVLVTVDTAFFAASTDQPGEGGFSPDLKGRLVIALLGHAHRLPPLSQPLGFLVLSRSFSVVRGEMTANLKLRRRVIEENYRSVLDKLYEEAGQPSDVPVWFLSAADSRMQELAALPPVRHIKTGRLTRWISLLLFLLRSSRAYARYAIDLHRTPWEYHKLRVDLLETLVRSFRDTVGPLKGPLVKIGQTLSYVDLGLSPHSMEILKGLQYKSPPLDSSSIRDMVRRSLGKPPSELFEDWHETPLASASISQIHLARLKDGRRVAVKIRYPGVERLVKSDLMAFQWLLPFISTLTGVQNIRDNFEEVRRLLLGECDFVREADFMRRFQAIFANHPRIVIPTVHADYSSDSVLTMDYVEGQSYAEFKATASQAEKDQAAETICEMGVVSAFTHGLFNADPHPGNYLFQPGKVCFLDFGFCKEWPKDFIQEWKRQTRAVIENDLVAFQDATEKIGLRRVGAAFDYAALLKSYRNTVERPCLEEGPFRFTLEFVKASSRELQKHQFEGKQKMFISPELLAQARVFWGQNSIFADLEASIDFHRVVLPHIMKDS